MLALRTWLTRLLVLAALLVPATTYADSASISVDLALTLGTKIAGTNLTFTITASNEGPEDASNASLTFAVPTNSTFVSLVTPPGWVCAPPLPPGGTGSTTCKKPTFVPGSEVFTLTVATSSSAPSGTSVKLDASITSTTADPNQNDNVNEIEVFLVRQSTLALTKTGPASAFAGTVITYTLAVNNTGPSFASVPTVNDTVAAPLRFVSITAPGWSCVTPAVGSPGLVSCSISDLPLGVRNLTLRLDTAPSTAPTTVTNSVDVSAPTDPGGLRTGSAMTQITTSADLTITKMLAPAPPVAGQSLTYTITVTQNGPSDAATVALNDPLPGTVLFQSITAPGWSCTTPPVGSSGTVSCTRSTLSPGTYTITIRGTVSASTPAGATISNMASVASSTPDPTLPNTATANATVSTQADLSIMKAASPTTPVAGQAITYTITVVQNGPSDAATVALNDPLPGAVLFQSITAPGWSCTTPPVGSSGTVSCTRSTLSPGTYTITIQGTVSASTPAGTTLANTASATSATPDPTLPNTATVSGTAATQADLSIMKAASPTTPVAGQAITYTITVVQNGPSDAATVALNDPLPGAVLFQSITAPGWSCTTPPVGASGTVSCTRSTLSPGTYTITIQGTVSASTPAGTTLANTASATSATPDPTLPNTATVSGTAATQADLTITKAASPTTPVVATTLTYTITVVQNGPSDAVNVTVTDPLPSAVLFQSVNAPGWTCATPAVGASGTVSCTRTPLPPGSYTITIQGVVAASTPAGATIANTATATSATPDPTLPNSATATGVASVQADLSITITDAPDPVLAGTNLTYQVVVTNGGPSDAVSPSLSVVLDAALGFLSVAPAPGWTCTTPASGASGTVACSAAAIAKAVSAAFTIVTVTRASVPPAPGSVIISTAASTTSSTTDPNPVNNSTSATTTVTEAPPIPTLSELAFVVMAAMLALAALLKLRAPARSGRSLKL